MRPFQRRVLVTGASGYLALHCVQQLLRQGYCVRGTVRDLQNERKVNPLKQLEYSSGHLELVEADLEFEEEWLRDCDYVLHVASPWPIVADERTITVAVNGTMNVVRAVAKCGTVRKVVVTSSCAAINDGHQNDERIFDESCWTDLSSKTVDNYARSKTLAEKAVWDFWSDLDESNRFQLTVLNPTFIIGPVLSDIQHGSAIEESFKIIGRMMDYKTFLAAPKVPLGMVDVRDVAAAHIKAMRSSATDGRRLLITSTPTVWFGDLTEWLRQEFSSQGYKITPITTPTWLFNLYLWLSIDPQAESVRHRIGPAINFDNSLVSYIFPAFIYEFLVQDIKNDE
uniref:3Beta_HSD domain-containing protein n=1 Tax=Syphacia muris TaxID=451379 RepID=A0A158R515_9BILA